MKNQDLQKIDILPTDVFCFNGYFYQVRGAFYRSISYNNPGNWSTSGTSVIENLLPYSMPLSEAYVLLKIHRLKPQSINPPNYKLAKPLEWGIQDKAHDVRLMYTSERRARRALRSKDKVHNTLIRVDNGQLTELEKSGCERLE